MATYSDIKDNAKHIVICRGLVVVISWYGQQQKICAKLTFNTPSSGAAPHFLWGNSSQNQTIIVVETRKSHQLQLLLYISIYTFWIKMTMIIKMEGFSSARALFLLIHNLTYWHRDCTTKDENAQNVQNVHY